MPFQSQLKLAHGVRTIRGRNIEGLFDVEIAKVSGLEDCGPVTICLRV